MEERNPKRDPDVPLTEEPGDEGATDIVLPTGEEMPLAMHDQGHRTFQETTPDDAFDARLTNPGRRADRVNRPPPSESHRGPTRRGARSVGRASDTRATSPVHGAPLL